MEEEFNKLKQQGKNTVDNLIKWIQHSKIVDTTKPSEDHLRKLFSGVQDNANVDYTKFQEAVGKLAVENKKSVEELSKSLIADANEVADAAASAAQAGANAAANAFKDKLKK